MPPNVGVRGDLSRVPRPRRTARAPAGSSPASTRSSSCERLREAADATPRRWEARHERRPAAAARRRRTRSARAPIDKGEDPALVDRALELDAERRRLLGESEALKAERNAASKQIGEAIKGGAAPDGPEVAELKAASRRGRRRGSPALDAELADDRGGRSTTSSCASPTRPTRTSRSVARRPTSRSGPGASCSPREQPLDGRGRRRRAGRRRDLDAASPHWELGEALDIIDNAARREDRRLRLPGLQGRRVGAPARRSSTGSSTSTPARTA